jgi:hypothetical protein
MCQTHITLRLFVCCAGTVTLAGQGGGLKAGFIKQELDALQEQQQQLDMQQHGGAEVPAAHMRHRASSSG